VPPPLVAMNKQRGTREFFTLTGHPCYQDFLSKRGSVIFYEPDEGEEKTTWTYITFPALSMLDNIITRRWDFIDWSQYDEQRTHRAQPQIQQTTLLSTQKKSYPPSEWLSLIN
jgi:hypothetical protein